jgi:hypothetical protein
MPGERQLLIGSSLIVEDFVFGHRRPNAKSKRPADRERAGHARWFTLTRAKHSEGPAPLPASRFESAQHSHRYGRPRLRRAKPPTKVKVLRTKLRREHPLRPRCARLSSSVTLRNRGRAWTAPTNELRQLHQAMAVPRRSEARLGRQAALPERRRA